MECSKLNSKLKKNYYIKMSSYEVTHSSYAYRSLVQRASKMSDARQNELHELQRQYRNMEINRRAYAEESQSLLRKQQSTIDKLRKDNDGLKSDIAMIMRSSNKPMSSTQLETLQKLQDAGDRYANSIDFERKNIQTMEEQILIMKQKVLSQRKAMGGVNASKDNHFMIQKQIRILENRLEKSLVKFNEAIAHNKDLRNEIDDLRRERVVFENVYRKMERELQDRKRKMAEIIELSNQSYEQRDSYQMEVAAIEQANRKEQEEFEEQMMELSRMLDTELRLPDPSDSKNMTGRNTSRGASSQALRGSGEMTSINKFGKTLEKGDVLASIERVQNFEEAFNKIKAATGIADVEHLVRNFIKNEDHNFSLFNYVNEQNNEIEKLEEQIQMLREEERKYAQESGEDAHQHKQILKELETKLTTTESMAEKYEIRAQDLQRAVESLKRGIQSIYEKLDIEDDGFGEPTVTESNMTHFLALVEQKANGLMQNYSDIRASLMQPIVGIDPRAGEESPSKSLVSVLGAGPKVPMGQELLTVQPPKLDEYQSDEDDDEDTRPFTRDELKSKTIGRLQRMGGKRSKQRR
jgi:coiled-coil domain-containing protein 63/114